MRASAVAEVARAEDIPVLTPQRPRGPEFEAELRALKPDISVVVAYGHILRPEILELPRAGSWNVHASLLPELRGAAPIHWAIARGYDTTGVTIMRMAEGMDDGPILHQVEEPIDPDETSTELACRLAEVGARAMIEGLAFLKYGGAEPREQDHARATYAPKVSRGVARIDWTRSPREVANHVRAMDEVPGAWTEWEGSAIKLFRPSVETEVTSLGARDSRSPGTVLSADPQDGGSLSVQVEGGAVSFREVQPSGKRRMPVGPWLRGRGAAPGDRFR
jgi:methionyl-tRNA formyltransferase